MPGEKVSVRDGDGGGAYGERPTLGSVVRGRRGELGLTLRALGAKVGCAISYLSAIENDRTSGLPSDEVLGRLEGALEMGPGVLVELARWQGAHPSLRREVARLADRQLAAQRLVDALREATRPGGGAGGVRSLDELHARGELHRLLGRVRGAWHAEGGEDGANAPSAAHGGRGSDGGGTSDESRVRGVSPTSGPSSGRGAAGGAGGVGGIAGLLPVEVPLINSVAAGYPTEFTDMGYPARVADEYVRVPDVRDPDAFAARVVGDSMEPMYREGDIVVFSPARAVGTAGEAGGGSGGSGAGGGGGGVDCFVRLEPDQESTFKRVYFERGAAGEELIRLQPLNAKYPPRVVSREQVAGLYAAVSVTRVVG
jgi:repressor LexA